MPPWRIQWDTIRRALQPRFRDFSSTLPQERAFCIACLARLSASPEDVVRRELQTLTGRIEMRVGTCWTCEQIQVTYRMKG